MTPRRHLVEVRTEDAAEYEPGQELSIDAFAEGSEVDVTGTTKGKGFAGTIKRLGLQVLPPYPRFSQERTSPRLRRRMRHSEPYPQGQAYGRPHGSRDRDRPEPDRHVR